ncbi:metal-sensing transcriptional repressor [Planococcus sp. FY231025]|uniref:metal-sensing transcriptional repressor n=1 Tax=Planococcus sp. FY231025 TaxID=3455699 RepID=UPI003F917650
MRYSKSVKHRIARVDGQLAGVVRMLEGGRGCEDVVAQLSAVTHALDRALGVIVSENLESCLQESGAPEDDVEIKVKKMIELLMKSE